MPKLRTGRLTESVDALVRSNAALFGGATQRFAAWRAEVAAGRLRAMSARDAYQALISARNQVAPRIGQSGLPAQYIEHFGEPVNTDLAAVWTAANTATNAFATWLGQSWPWRTPEGYPAFERARADGELESIIIDVSGATQTAILAQIDAVLAVIE